RRAANSPADISALTGDCAGSGAEPRGETGNPVQVRVVIQQAAVDTQGIQQEPDPSYRSARSAYRCGTPAKDPGQPPRHSGGSSTAGSRSCPSPCTRRTSSSTCAPAEEGTSAAPAQQPHSQPHTEAHDATVGNSGSRAAHARKSPEDTRGAGGPHGVIQHLVEVTQQLHGFLER